MYELKRRHELGLDAMPEPKGHDVVSRDWYWGEVQCLDLNREPALRAEPRFSQKSQG